jgi:hypothetical protein
VRAGELERWRASGAYDAILAGTYARRGDMSRGLGDDYAEAASYYSARVRSAVDSVGDALKRARDAFRDAFRGSAPPPPPEPAPPA